VPRFPLKKGQQNSFHVAARPAHLKVLASLKLTSREAEVLFWISEGKSNQDIGVILGASTRTICKHVEHILCKLSVENRTAAAVVALEKCPIAERSGTKWRQPQTMIVGLIAQQLADLWSDSCEIYGAITALIA
jgi:DNA-binding CsgD family transcriptional regulator